MFLSSKLRKISTAILATLIFQVMPVWAMEPNPVKSCKQRALEVVEKGIKRIDRAMENAKIVPDRETLQELKSFYEQSKQNINQLTLDDTAETPMSVIFNSFSMARTKFFGIHCNNDKYVYLKNNHGRSFEKDYESLRQLTVPRYAFWKHELAEKKVIGKQEDIKGEPSVSSNSNKSNSYQISKEQDSKNEIEQPKIENKFEKEPLDILNENIDELRNDLNENKTEFDLLKKENISLEEKNKHLIDKVVELQKQLKQAETKQAETKQDPEESGQDTSSPEDSPKTSQHAEIRKSNQQATSNKNFTNTTKLEEEPRNNQRGNNSQQQPQPPQDHATADTKDSSTNKDSSDSNAKWIAGGLGAAALALAIWRVISYVKPSYDGTLDEKAQAVGIELESRQLALKRAQDELQLCEDMIKRAQAALSHANDMTFVEALWKRAKHLGSLTLLPERIKEIDSLIEQKKPQEIINHLTKRKSCLQRTVNQVKEVHAKTARTKHEIEDKRDKQSVFGLIKNGMIDDVNKVASWVGLGPFFKSEEKEQKKITNNKPVLPAVVAKTSVQATMPENVKEARDYLGGLKHLSAIAQKAVNGRSSRGQEGWMVTDALGESQCAMVRKKVSDGDLQRLKTSITQFEQSFGHKDPVLRGQSVEQRCKELKQIIEEFKTNSVGQQAQQLLTDYNAQINQQRTQSQLNVKPKPKVKSKADTQETGTAQGASKPKAGKPAQQPQQEQALEGQDQGGLLEKGLSWLSNNKLLAGGLLALTVAGVVAEIGGFWPFDQKSGAAEAQE